MMCGLVVFSGSCTKCGESQTWDDLGLQLACLQAKNTGYFGQCETGIFAEQHEVDQIVGDAPKRTKGLVTLAMTPLQALRKATQKSIAKSEGFEVQIVSY